MKKSNLSTLNIPVSIKLCGADQLGECVKLRVRVDTSDIVIALKASLTWDDARYLLVKKSQLTSSTSASTCGMVHVLEHVIVITWFHRDGSWSRELFSNYIPDEVIDDWYSMNDICIFNPWVVYARDTTMLMVANAMGGRTPQLFYSAEEKLKLRITTVKTACRKSAYI